MWHYYSQDVCLHRMLHAGLTASVLPEGVISGFADIFSCSSGVDSISVVSVNWFVGLYRALLLFLFLLGHCLFSELRCGVSLFSFFFAVMFVLILCDSYFYRSMGFFFGAIVVLLLDTCFFFVVGGWGLLFVFVFFYLVDAFCGPIVAL